MALQALAKYQDSPDVRAATDRALSCLSESPGGDRGYAGWGSANSESAAQVLVALDELGIPVSDGRFAKNAGSLFNTNRFSEPSIILTKSL
jgi:hypothetical protein